MTFKNVVILFRFPFSLLLMPVFLFAVSRQVNVDPIQTLLIFLSLHLFIYPASNAYNSYMDQDTSSVGGIKNPPLAGKSILYLSFVFDILGILFAAFVHLYFAVGVVVYVMVSRAYSWHGIRLKKHPILSFLAVIIFQGAFIYFLVYHFCQLDFIGFEPVKNWFLPAFICSLNLAGIYPLTQVYQHEQDKQSGDITLSLILGIKGTFVFSQLIFLLSGACMIWYLFDHQLIKQLYIYLVLVSPLLIYFTYWMRLVWADPKQANFKHTMAMNIIAAACMNTFFTSFILFPV